LCFVVVFLTGADIVCYCPPLDNAAQITALTVSSMMLELVTLIADLKTRKA
jgi:arginase family enzyme